MEKVNFTIKEHVSSKQIHNSSCYQKFRPYIALVEKQSCQKNIEFQSWWLYAMGKHTVNTWEKGSDFSYSVMKYSGEDLTLNKNQFYEYLVNQT